MSATLPVRLPAVRAEQASAADVSVPVRTSVAPPEMGAFGEPVACVYPTFPSNAGVVDGTGGTVKYGSWTLTLSNDATPMTFAPTPGAPDE